MNWKVFILNSFILWFIFYTYISWEYEKIDTIDPIDTIGVTISYFIYGSFILKIGPLYSIFNSVWCVNKVRHSVGVGILSVRVSMLMLLQQHRMSQPEGWVIRIGL